MFTQTLSRETLPIAMAAKDKARIRRGPWAPLVILRCWAGKDAREEMTVGKAASLIGVSPSSVTQWENHDRRPETDSLRKMSRAFDVSLDELDMAWDGWWKQWTEWHEEERARNLQPDAPSPIEEVLGVPLPDELKDLFGDFFEEIGSGSIALLQKQTGLFVHWFNQLLILKGEDESSREERLKALRLAIDEYMRRRSSGDGQPPSGARRRKPKKTR